MSQQQQQQQQEPRILLLPISSLSAAAQEYFPADVSSTDENDHHSLVSKPNLIPRSPVRRVNYHLNVPFKDDPPAVLPPLSRRSRFGNSTQRQARPVSNSTGASSFRVSLYSATPGGSTTAPTATATRRPSGFRPSQGSVSQFNAGTESSLRPPSKYYTVKLDKYFKDDSRPRSQLTQTPAPAPPQFKRSSPATASLMSRSAADEELKTEDEALSELRALVARIVEQTQNSSPNYGPTLVQRSRSAKLLHPDARNQLAGRSVADPNQVPLEAIAVASTSSASRSSHLPDQAVSVQVHSSGSPQALQTLSIGHQSAAATASSHPQAAGGSSVNAYSPLHVNVNADLLVHANATEQSQAASAPQSTTSVRRRSILAQVPVQVALAPNSLLGPTLPANGKLAAPLPPNAGPTQPTSGPNPAPTFGAVTSRIRVSELGRLSGANNLFPPAHTLFAPATSGPGSRGGQSPSGLHVSPLAAAPPTGASPQSQSASQHSSNPSPAPETTSPEAPTATVQKLVPQRVLPAAAVKNGTYGTSDPSRRADAAVLEDVRSQKSGSSVGVSSQNSLRQQTLSLRASAFRQPPPPPVAASTSASTADAGAGTGAQAAASPGSATTSTSPSSTTSRTTPADAMESPGQQVDSLSPARRSDSASEDATAATSVRSPGAPRDTAAAASRARPAALPAVAGAVELQHRASLAIPGGLVAKATSPATGLPTIGSTGNPISTTSAAPSSSSLPPGVLQPIQHTTSSVAIAAGGEASRSPTAAPATNAQSQSQPTTTTQTQAQAQSSSPSHSLKSTSSMPLSTPVLPTPATSHSKTPAPDDDDEARFSDDEDALSAIGTDRDDDVGTYSCSTVHE